MTTTIQESGNQVIASFEGRLDTASADKTAAAVKPLQDVRDKEVILDCSKLDYISSSGLRIFLSLRKEAAAHGCRIIVRNMNANVHQVFVMTGFIGLFEIQ